MENSSKKTKVLINMANTGHYASGIQQDLFRVMEALIQDDKYDISLLWYDVVGRLDIYKLKNSQHKSKSQKIVADSQAVAILTGSDSVVINRLGRLAKLYNNLKLLSHVYDVLFKRSFQLIKIDKVFNNLIIDKFLTKVITKDVRDKLSNVQIFIANYSDFSDIQRSRVSSKLPRPNIDTYEFDFFITATERGLKVSPNTKQIIRVYDLIPILCPTYVAGAFHRSMYQDQSIRQSIKTGSIFVADSEPVIKDFQSMYPNLRNENAFSIAPAISDIYFNEVNATKLLNIIESRYSLNVFGIIDDDKKDKILEQLQNLEFDYILTVGTIEPRKNILGMLKMYSEIADKYFIQNKRKLKYIYVGGLGWMYQDIIASMRSHVLKGEFILLSDVTNSEIRILMSMAKAFTFISFEEGFGMPPLEAMACGCPVLSSGIPVHKWAQGDAAFYTDPYDIKDASEQLMKILTHRDSEEVKEKIELGYLQAKKYSQYNIKNQWLELLDKLSSEPNSKN